MSVNPEPNSLKTDITDFIQLLQKQSSNRRRLSLDSDKLSIIYSASQPQSSSLISNKQNSHQSANTNANLQDLHENDEVQNIIKEIIKIGVNQEQVRLINRLSLAVSALKKSNLGLDARCKALETQFEEEKAGTDQILKALIKMDEAEKQLWSTYNQLSLRHEKLQQKCKGLRSQNKQLHEQLSQNHKDIEFMRKLVLVANENYENLQRKCSKLERNMSIMQTFKQQRSSPEIISRSTIVNPNKKSSCSPSISDRSNMSAKGGSFEENYRKLVLRTLKSKATK